LSYKIAVIGDLETATGFALAGVLYAHVHVEKEETLSKLDELFADETMGLVMITHSVVDELGDEFRQRMREKKLFPIVLKIPDKTGMVPKVDELYELIRRTVGAEVVVRAEGR
jgi:V/A-type H+-transporting ATPase subunit F